MFVLFCTTYGLAGGFLLGAARRLQAGRSASQRFAIAVLSIGLLLIVAGLVGESRQLDRLSEHAETLAIVGVVGGFIGALMITRRRTRKREIE